VQKEKLVCRRNAMRFIWLLIACCLSIETPVTAQQSSLPTNAPLKIRLEFRIKPDELKELRGVLEQFAQTEDFVVNDIGARMPPRHGRPLFYLELDQGDSLKVTVINIRAEDRMFVWFYEFQPSSSLREVDHKLERVLREKWPTLAPYEGS
jgi:hypothetical protein